MPLPFWRVDPAGSSTFRVKLLFLCWGLPVLSFLWNPSYQHVGWLVWLATVVTVFLSFRNVFILVLSVPFFSQLSPLATNCKIFGLLPSEFLIFLVILLACFRIRFYSLRMQRSEFYLSALSMVAISSYIFSFEYDLLLPSIISLFGLVSVFMLTRKSLQSRTDVDIFLTTLAVTCVYISAITLAGYFRGMILADFIYTQGEVYLDLKKLKFFFRASYFYTNVLYVLCPGLIVAAIFTIKRKTWIARSLWISATSIIIAALYVMFSKTGILATGISIISMSAVLLIHRLSRYKISPAVPVFMFLILIIAGFLVATNLFNATRITELPIDSFLARTRVAYSSLLVVLDNPLRMLTGFGPDATIRLNTEAIQLAKSSQLNKVEGAVDSAYMSFLVEYGFVFLLLLICCLFNNIKMCFRIFIDEIEVDHISLIFFGIFVFIASAAIAQIIGVSKVGWVVFQIFAVAQRFYVLKRRETGIFKRLDHKFVAYDVSLLPANGASTIQRGACE